MSIWIITPSCRRQESPLFASQEMAGLGLGTPPAALLLELKKENVHWAISDGDSSTRLEPRGFAQLIGFPHQQHHSRIHHRDEGRGILNFRFLRANYRLLCPGITPEDVKTMKQQYPNASVQDLIEFHAHQANGNNIGALPANHNIQPPASLNSATPPAPSHGSRRQPGPWWANSGPPPGPERGNLGPPDNTSPPPPR